MRHVRLHPGILALIGLMSITLALAPAPGAQARMLPAGRDALPASAPAPATTDSAVQPRAPQEPTAAVCPTTQGRRIFLPFLRKAATAQRSPEQTVASRIRIQEDPDLRITSPDAGATIAGTLFFAVQATGTYAPTCAAFRIGSTALGIDQTPADGLQVILDTALFPAGPQTLTATSVDSQGVAVTTSIPVTISPAAPSSAAVTTAGATLEVASGSTVIVPAGSLSATTTINVAEKTQQQVTAERSIDWESQGVTFLGALDVESDGTFARPLGVTSVGYANRIQPNQAVVTYNILPDQNGDGIGEIVVVNGATVAANGTILSNPVTRPGIHAATVTQNQPGLSQRAETTIHGAAGALIDLEMSGLNPLSAHGNVAIFESLVDGRTFDFPGIVSAIPASPGRSTMSVFIPPLPVGAATLTIRNLTTGETTDPLPITVDASAPLVEPAGAVIDRFFGTMIAVVQSLPALTSVAQTERAALITKLNQQRADFQTLSADQAPEVQQVLTPIAQMLSNVAEQDVSPAAFLQMLGECITPEDRKFAKNMINFAETLTSDVLCQVIGLKTRITDLCELASLLYYDGYLDTYILDNVPNCSPQPVDCVNAPNGSTNGGGGTMLGMGSVAPSGGKGCGTIAGGSASASNQRGRGAAQGNRYVIKLFSNNTVRPFSGLADPGGYFFLPIIPAGETFVAVAIDMQTGQTRTVTGVGPPVGKSVAMVFDFLHAEDQRPTIVWDGGGNGTAWNDPLNWDLNRVPGVADRVRIDVPTAITVAHPSGNTGVLSLHSAESLQIAAGTLTVYGGSHISGTLTMQSGTSIIARGPGARLTVSGPTQINEANVSALSGGAIHLPSLTSYSTGANSRTLRASGPGSVLDMPNLTNLIGSTTSTAGYRLTLEALGGGQVKLNSLAGISSGDVTLLADGANSQIQLNALAFSTTSSDYDSSIEARNGGQIALPNLTQTTNMSWRLNATGTVPTAQLTRVTNGAITVDGVAANLSGITTLTDTTVTLKNGGTANLANASSVTAADFDVSGGVTLSLPAVTTYAAGASDHWLRASGPGSVLEFPNLTTLSGSSDSYWGYGLELEALSGGLVKLNSLAGITSGDVTLLADGVNSQIQLNALTAITARRATYSTIDARNGGQISAPALTQIANMTLNLYPTGTFPTAQLTQVTIGAITVDGVAANLSGITTLTDTTVTLKNGGTANLANASSVTAADFDVSGGVTLSLPAVTTYAAGASDHWLRASGPGSVLEFPNLTTLSGSSDSYWGYGLELEALSGGQVKLNSLAGITSGDVTLLADGVNSQIQLNALTAITARRAYYSTIDARNGGQISAPALTQIANMTLNLYPTGTFPTAQLTQVTIGAITVDGVAANLSGITTLTDTTVTLKNGGTANLANASSVTAADFDVSGGVTLSLPAVTTYAAGASDHWLRASGPGSVLEFPNLTTLSGSSDSYWGYGLELEALSGGRVRLNSLTGITSGDVTLLADGVNSQIQLNALTAITARRAYYSTIDARNGGQISAPALTQIANMTLNLYPTGTFPTAQLTRLTTGAITVDGAAANLSGITNLTDTDVTLKNGGTATLANASAVNAASFDVSGGVTLSLPAVTTYAGGSFDYFFRASGPGSVLEFPNLTTLNGSTGGVGYEVALEARSGGQLKLRALPSMTTGRIIGLADGVGSVLDLSSLATFTANGSLTATNGGVILRP